MTEPLPPWRRIAKPRANIGTPAPLPPDIAAIGVEDPTAMSWRERLRVAGAFVVVLLLGELAEPVVGTARATRRGFGWFRRRATKAPRRRDPKLLEAQRPRDML